MRPIALLFACALILAGCRTGQRGVRDELEYLATWPATARHGAGIEWEILEADDVPQGIRDEWDRSATLSTARAGAEDEWSRIEDEF